MKGRNFKEKELAMSVRIRFNKRLYKKSALKDAAEDFGHLAKIEISEDGEYFDVSMTEIDPDVEDVIKEEFANFALYYSVERRKSW